MVEQPRSFKEETNVVTRVRIPETDDGDWGSAHGHDVAPVSVVLRCHLPVTAIIVELKRIGVKLGRCHAPALLLPDRSIGHRTGQEVERTVAGDRLPCYGVKLHERQPEADNGILLAFCDGCGDIIAWCKGNAGAWFALKSGYRKGLGSATRSYHSAPGSNQPVGGQADRCNDLTVCPEIEPHDRTTLRDRHNTKQRRRELGLSSLNGTGSQGSRR